LALDVRLKVLDLQRRGKRISARYATRGQKKMTDLRRKWSSSGVDYPSQKDEGVEPEMKGTQLDGELVQGGKSFQLIRVSSLDYGKRRRKGVYTIPLEGEKGKRNENRTKAGLLLTVRKYNEESKHQLQRGNKAIAGGTTWGLGRGKKGVMTRAAANSMYDACLRSRIKNCKKGVLQEGKKWNTQGEFEGRLRKGYLFQLGGRISGGFCSLARDGWRGSPLNRTWPRRGVYNPGLLVTSVPVYH